MTYKFNHIKNGGYIYDKAGLLPYMCKSASFNVFSRPSSIKIAQHGVHENNV